MGLVRKINQPRIEIFTRKELFRSLDAQSLFGIDISAFDDDMILLAIVDVLRAEKANTSADHFRQ